MTGWSLIGCSLRCVAAEAVSAAGEIVGRAGRAGPVTGLLPLCQPLAPVTCVSTTVSTLMQRKKNTPDTRPGHAHTSKHLTQDATGTVAQGQPSEEQCMTRSSSSCCCTGANTLVLDVEIAAICTDGLLPGLKLCTWCSNLVC